ncbi:Lrp/AsnC family transcriptional regulator [Pseudarthrobacter sp. S9]|uniref:Lrp/AsnC family transcriptional regulator n=1 Tax=Pseudarthrobacter sp. S9 TaxID=3418421 RepID=UPI003D07F41E
MHDLDDGLVRLLQADGRASFSDLAKQLGATRAAITAKVNELTASGEVRIVAALHPRVLGLNALAHVSIRLSGPAREVLDRLAHLDGAVFASLTTGPYGIIAELRLPSVPELFAQIDVIRRAPGVSGVDVHMYKELVRSLFLGKETPRAGLVLDQVDLRIMAELQIDGRMSFEALGEHVDLSPSATRTRMLRLIDNGVMQIGAIRRRSGSDRFMTYGFGVSTVAETDEVVDYFSNLPGIEFIATTFGRHDMLATVGVSSLDEVTSILDDLRRLDSVVEADSWLHLRIVQERYEKPLDNLVVASA